MEPLAALTGVLVVLLALWLVLVLLVWLHRPTRELAGPALRLVPDVARLVRRLLAERGTPWPARVALIFLLAWIVSPIDLIPEFLPIGLVDDIVVAVLVLRFVLRRLPPDRLLASWPGTPDGIALLRRLLRIEPSPA